MNKVILMGRLTKDPQVNYNGELAIARYTIAVDRKFTRDVENGTDFIKCVAFGRRGEFAEKYFYKGLKIIIDGRIQTGSYEDRNGNTVYTTDIVIENQEFVESKQERTTPQAEPIPQPKEESKGDAFMDVNENVNLPFNT